MSTPKRMLQVVQRQRDGQLGVREVPPPVLRDGTALVRLECSLISAGTERSKVEMAQKGLVAKARARPDLARQVIAKARTEGLRDTVERVRSRLEQWEPLGYSAAGRVVQVAPGYAGPSPGELVACAGAGLANHAEYVLATSMLSAAVPAGVTAEQACFGTVGAIAMQGVRQADVKLGERVAVIGLGLVGQLTVQLLKASGCHVLGVDLREDLCAMARRSGADAAIPRSELGDIPPDFSTYDAAIVTAAAPTSDPVHLGGLLCRDRGTVVVVGDVKLDLSRDLFYNKELELRLSRSYGPGRYDTAYEEKGLDYPVGYVRWTEQRNLAAFLELIKDGKVDTSVLNAESFAVTEATAAYERLQSEASDDRPLAIVLRYPERAPDFQREPVQPRGQRAEKGIGIAMIGAGNFAQGTLFPQLRQHDVRFRAVTSASGLSAETAATRMGFERTLADPAEAIEDPEVDLVVIVTRHDSHAELVERSLRAGKATYVEKPLAIGWEQLARVRAALAETTAPLFVGFNRRFAPLTAAAIQALAPDSAKTLTYRVNAGPRSAGHWLDDPEVGGGALLGEGCHFVDLAAYLCQAEPTSVSAFTTAAGGAVEAAGDFSIQVSLSDGSHASVVYTTGGDASFAKEHIEIFGGGRVVVVDNFRQGHQVSGGHKHNLRAAAGKGWAEQIAWMMSVMRGEAEPPDPRRYLLTTGATLAALTSLRTGRAVALDPTGWEIAAEPDALPGL